MSHTTSNASSATQTWPKSTQSLESNLKDQDSTQQITECTFCGEEAAESLTVVYPKSGTINHCLQCYKDQHNIEE